MTKGWRGWWRRGASCVSWYWCLLVTWLLVTTHYLLVHHAPAHPALAPSCYQPHPDRAPRNFCCRLHHYVRRDILTCVHRRSRYAALHGPPSAQGHTDGHHFHSPNEYLVHFNYQSRSNESSAGLRTSSAQQQQAERESQQVWVMVGDSRIRQVFSVLVSSLASPRLKYNKPSTGGKWRSVHELMDSLRIGKLHEDIKVQHLDVPLTILFYWDPLLHRLPSLLSQWTNNSLLHSPPSLLLLGSGLHWMESTLHTYRTAGAQAALHKYQQHMNNLLPQLAYLAHSTLTIIQLQDHVQESQIFKKFKGIYSNENIELYNQFLSSFTSGTGIVVWGSTVPFSEAYHAQCRLHPQKTYDKLWDCDSPLHTGFVMVQEYTNMLLNDLCNPHLFLDSDHC